MARPTILLVDDDETMLESFPRIFRREPYDTLVAGSAGAALALLQSRPVDVIVSDEQMWGMRGTELLRRVRDERAGVARILLTGAVDYDRELFAECADYVLIKPVRTAELRVAVAEALVIGRARSQ